MSTTLIKRVYFAGSPGDQIEIHAGQNSPNGSISAPYGSIYLFTGSGAVTVWQKDTGSGNTGWTDLRRPAIVGGYGLVKQSANVTDSEATLPSSDAASSATDVAGVVTDLNDLIDKYNTMLTLVTELKSKLNAKLTADRVSGQQSTT